MVTSLYEINVVRDEFDLKKILFFIAITAVIGAMLLFLNNPDNKGNVLPERPTPSINQTVEMPQIGYKAPGFKLKGLDGKDYSLEQIKGKPVVVNFWTSWCPPCKQEAPELVKLYNQHRGKLEIYAVNLTAQDTLEDAQEFVNEYGFSFPVLLDQEGTVGQGYQLQGIPTTIFINKEGLIVDRVVGYSSQEILAQKFEKLANSKY